MKKSCSQTYLDNYREILREPLPLSLQMGAEKKYLVVVAGPTAVGKTDLAIQLARHYQSVILSADSRQFYKELNIGTAKPDPQQLEAARHYFINTRHIGELYGAGHYEKDALALLDTLFKEHQLVFMAGGSGLYLDAVLNGVDEFVEVPAGIREQLNARFSELGLAWLQEEIRRRDPAYYDIADIQNPQRLIRALEVIEHTGSPYSGFLRNTKAERPFTAIKLLINMERTALYQRINERVEHMMQRGLLEEARQVEAFRHMNALRTVGYKELYDYLDHKISLETAVEKIKQHTRNYAKRQLTWFRNKDDFEAFGPDDFTKITGYIDIIMSHG
jgi:tRNA dimethylallyltransferase